MDIPTSGGVGRGGGLGGGGGGEGGGLGGGGLVLMEKKGRMPTNCLLPDNASNSLPCLYNYYGAMLLHPAGIRHVMLEMKRKLAKQRVYVKAGLWTGLDSGLDHGLDHGLLAGTKHLQRECQLL